MNLHGQLGLGDSADRGVTPNQMGDALAPAGVMFSWALLAR